MIEPLRLSVDIECSTDHAFRVWTARFSQWWPADHTVSGEKDSEIVFEGHVGGKIFERTAAGATHEWGEITMWEPPRRLGYLWYLRRDRADATVVEIAFVDRAGATTVHIEHRGWDRLGAQGSDWREANTAGWTSLFPHFIKACDGEPDRAD